MSPEPHEWHQQQHRFLKHHLYCLTLPRNNFPEHPSQCYTPFLLISECSHSSSPPPASKKKCKNFPLVCSALQCTWNSILALCTGFRAVQSSCVHQVMWSSQITHANKTLNHNCSDPGHNCTVTLGYEIQLITCRACWR